jgi:nicotinate phosphoribosyltransferase
MSDTLGVDTYQLTTLVAHADAGRLEQELAMAFFFRKLPRERNFVVFCGLRQVLEHAADMSFSAEDLATLSGHPLLGPAIAARPALLRALRDLDGFQGTIDALPEGTLSFAGPGLREDGSPFTVLGTRVTLYTPLLQATTGMLEAKLIETPWLSSINHASMVASKAARIVLAAGGRPVLEFGQRRTHPDEAVDASYAAWIAGCAATSNVRASQRWGVPAQGTMDHFMVQAAEQPGVATDVSERAAFTSFATAFPSASTLLVDTYDTLRGIRNAVAATNGQLSGIRLDSAVTPELIRKARALLDSLGAPTAQIFVSDGLDEWRVAELAAAGADGFGVGENITCVPDAATGVGAVAKVIVNGYGRITMKLARGSGKATLPGMLQVYRYPDHDLIATAEEPPPSSGRALLEPVWRDRSPIGPGREPASAVRARVAAQLAELPAHLRGLDVTHGQPWPLVVSDALAARVDDCVRQAALEPEEVRP